MQPTVKIFETETPEFWLLMGRFFAHRLYAHEMGGWQFYTKPGSVWFVLLVGEDVRGFCSAINEGKYFYFDNFYVLKEWRGVGYGSILHNARIEWANKLNMEIRVISNNPIQIKKYLEQGFLHVGWRGRYSKFKRLPK